MAYTSRVQDIAKVTNSWNWAYRDVLTSSLFSVESVCCWWRCSLRDNTTGCWYRIDRAIYISCKARMFRQRQTVHGSFPARIMRMKSEYRVVIGSIWCTVVPVFFSFFYKNCHNECSYFLKCKSIQCNISSIGTTAFIISNMQTKPWGVIPSVWVLPRPWLIMCIFHEHIIQEDLWEHAFNMFKFTHQRP